MNVFFDVTVSKRLMIDVAYESVYKAVCHYLQIGGLNVYMPAIVATRVEQQLERQLKTMDEQIITARQTVANMTAFADDKLARIALELAKIERDFMLNCHTYEQVWNEKWQSLKQAATILTETEEMMFRVHQRKLHRNGPFSMDEAIIVATMEQWLMTADETLYYVADEPLSVTHDRLIHLPWTTFERQLARQFS